MIHTPKTIEFAKLLLVMIERGHLKNPEFNNAVGVLVREAMETKLPHCTTAYRSLRAAEIITALAPRSASQYHRRCAKTANRLRHEHMVPTSERIRILREMSNPTTDAIAQSLSMFGLRATIHFDEDKVLNDAKLKSKMPAEFWDEKHELHMNPLARYIVTGLLPNLRPRQGACWFTDEQAPLR